MIALGQVERRLLIDLLKSADLFVQPGRPGPFNDYRLPSKLPEFMAVGRPIVLPFANVGTRLRDGVDAMLLREGIGRGDRRSGRAKSSPSRVLPSGCRPMRAPSRSATTGGTGR